MRVTVQILAALLVLVIFVTCSALVLRRVGEVPDESGAGFVNLVNEAAYALFTDYVEPARTASLETSGRCPTITLPSEDLACGEWVSVLDDLEPVLVSRIDRLRVLQLEGMD